MGIPAARIASSEPADPNPQLTCNTAATVFGVTQSGSFFVYPHNEPENGRAEINNEGHLKVFVWDDVSNDWTPETAGGKIFATDWNQYDLLVAAGDGVLYARKPNGRILRFRYHASSDRFVENGVPVGHGWQKFNRIFSLGGDILYGTQADNDGNLVWYRYFEEINTWANNARGKIVGTGWYGELDVVATTDDCRLANFATP